MKKNNPVQSLLITVEAQACKNRFYEFLLSFWSEIIQEEFIPNWHIEYICDELQELSKNIVSRKDKLYDLIINVPPGSTKTTIVLQMFPAWLWVQDDSLRVISSSHSSSLSIEAASKTRDILNSSKFRALFPNIKLKKDKSAKTAYETTRNGTRDITSTGSSPTGRHAHIKLMDDLMDIQKSSSPAHRHQAIEHMKALFTREVEKGKSVNVLIMQRLHEQDCTAFLKSLQGKRKIKHICLPAEVSDRVSPPELKDKYTNGLLDPVRMSASILAMKKVELGTYGYNSQFQQAPTSPEGDLIKRKWFKIVPRHVFRQKQSNQTFYFFIDTAYEEKKKIKKSTGEATNDPTGLLAAVEIDGVCYLTDYREVYMELPDLVRFIYDWALSQEYSENSIIYIEPKASGKSTVQTLRTQTKLNVTEIEGRKDSKETELNNASPAIESGRFALIEADWNELFLDRVCGFPHAAHDEAVDVLCYAKKYFFGMEIDEEGVNEAYSKALALLK